MNISPYIYIGYNCNNNCVFCSEADEYLENLKLKTLDQIKKEIVQARGKYDIVNFMGREPTLRDDFIDILEFTAGLGFGQVGMTTNGRMFAYQKFARRVLKTGINQIGISLAGATPRTHDKITQVPGSFEQTLKGIMNIIAFKKPEMSLLINIPLARLNYFELDKMIGLLKNLGVKEINILFIAPLSKRSRSREIVMGMKELGGYVFKIIKLYLDGSIKFLLVEFLPCSLPEEAQKYFFPCLEKNPEKVRIPLCEKCQYQKNCDGVLRSYIDLYGNKEFKL